MKVLALICALFAALPASAQMFDSLSPTDRDTLRQEIRDYLLEEPELLLEVIALIEERREQQAADVDRDRIAQNEAQIYADGVSYVSGNPDGDITIVEFFDYQCSFCKRAHPEVTELLSTDGNIRLVKKEFPILGPVSEQASRAAIAVLLEDGGEIYKTFSDSMMSHDGSFRLA